MYSPLGASKSQLRSSSSNLESLIRLLLVVGLVLPIYRTQTTPPSKVQAESGFLPFQGAS